MKKTTAPDLVLYHYWRSSCSWRVRWALKHKEISYQDIPVNLLKNEQNHPAFLAVNPSGFVPALSVNGTIFGESMAMLEWIEETFPQKPLLPQSPIDKMRVRQICQMIASGIQPIQNLSVMRYHSPEAAQQAAWSRHWIELGLSKVEKLVAQHAGTYCVGGQLSFADLCLVPQIYNALRFNVSLDAFPTLRRINDHCLTLPACDAAAPQNSEGS